MIFQPYTHTHTHTHTTSANTWCQKTQAWWKESVSPPSPHNGAKITLNLRTLTSHPKQHKLSRNQTLINPCILLSRLPNSLSLVQSASCPDQLDLVKQMPCEEICFFGRGSWGQMGQKRRREKKLFMNSAN